MKSSTPPTVRIADVAEHQDREIRISGWLYNLRSKGKIHFLQLRDEITRFMDKTL